MDSDTDEAGRVWSETDSRQFIDNGHYYVPEREEQIATICRAIPEPSEPVVMVELCCGAGLLSKALLERFGDARLLALDGSETMLAATRANAAAHSHRLETRQFDLAASDWRSFDTPLHAVVSSLAVHHLNHDEKRALFRDMSGALGPAGVLVIADLMQPLTSEGREIAARAWDDAVRIRARETDGNLAAFERFQADDWNLYRDPEPDPVDKPSPLFDQLRWLEEAGLEAVEVHWMKAGHAIFSARKPATAKR